VIFHYDDISGGVPGTSGIVRIPDGKTSDDVFMAWIRKKEGDPTLTMKNIEKDPDRFMYYWTDSEVTEVEV
jgi:hypothetical protein